ncbi:MAG TPA: sugar phosphate nucleotidyltransferase, partial [Fimbriimonas sp.]|nr:sugar phosphate nucleotidyltransferase [Fimbriimonas sp.]
LLEEAVERVAELVGRENVYIATATHLQEPIAQAGIVPSNNVIAEPDKRNTLGCLTWVAATFGANTSDVSMAILTADHLILEPDDFRSTLKRAFEHAEETGDLVTLGIAPTRPETGYGYIEAGDTIAGTELRKVNCFKEKPELEIAQQYVASGRHFWNSGMFIWKLNSFLRELAHSVPVAYDLTQQMANEPDMDLRGELFRRLPNLSVDYAVMEKAHQVAMIQATFPWDDVGAFDSLFRTMPKDENGNVIIGRVEAVDCENCILYNDSADSVLGAIGQRHQIVIQTPDATIVVPVSQAQSVKQIVGRLSDSKFV